MFFNSGYSNKVLIKSTRYITHEKLLKIVTRKSKNYYLV